MATQMSSVGNRKAKKAGEEANRLIQGLSGEPDDAVLADTKAHEDEAPKAKVEASADADKNLDQTLSPKPGAEPAKAEDDWEKRYKGMLQTYNRDVPKLRGELESAISAVDSLKSEIADLREEVNKPVETAAEEQTVIELTPEEVEQYGPGWIEMMKRIAQGSSGDLAKQVVNLQQKLAELQSGQEKIEQHAVVTDEDRYFTRLRGEVSNWEEINHDPKFHEFLAQIVPYTGKERQVFLQEARQEFDVETTIQIFNDYLNIVPQGSSQDSDSKPDLDVPEDMVTPKNSGGGAPPIPEQKIYTDAEISQFYKDKSAGLYKGKEAEAKKIEKDIFAAGAQGRIRSNRAANKAFKFSKEDLS